MLLKTYNLQPSEARRVPIDYSNWLATSEIITQLTITVASTPPEGVESPAAFAVFGQAIEPVEKKAIYFNAGGGEDGGYYKLTLVVQTNDLQIREDEIEFYVTEE